MYSPQLLIKRENVGKLIYFISATPSVLMIRSGNMSGVNGLNIKIYDQSGRVQLSRQISYSDNELNISKLASGAYIVKISAVGNKEVYSQKFIK